MLEKLEKCRDVAIASGAHESYQAVREAFDELRAAIAAAEPQAQDKSDNYLSGYCTGRTDLLKEQSAQPVGVNGLTEAETSATMSVMGLSKPAQPLELSDAEIEDLRNATFSTNNPFCPVDSKSMRKAVRAALAAANKKAGK